jgi:hypothetical protein
MGNLSLQDRIAMGMSPQATRAPRYEADNRTKPWIRDPLSQIQCNGQGYGKCGDLSCPYCYPQGPIRPLPSSPIPPIQLPDLGEVSKALKRHHVHVIYNPNDSPITVKVGGAEVVLGPGQSVEVR